MPISPLSPFPRRTRPVRPPAARCFSRLGAGVLCAGLLLRGAASADLLTDLQAYYTFESETASVAPNTARTLGHPGFENDGARLQGGEPATASVPLSSAAGSFRAGTAALACDGDADYADLAVCPVMVDQDFTVSVWFKPQTGGAGLTGAVRSFVMETKPGYGISFGLRAGGSAGTTAFQIYSDALTGTDPNQSVDLPNEEVDKWHHFVCVYTAEDNTMLGYLDGQMTYQLTLPDVLSSATGFNTGTYRSNNGRWFKGFVDEQVFWQRALTEAEATALFTGGDAGKSFATFSGEAGNATLRTGLTAYYSFDSQIDRAVANAAVALGAPGFEGDAALLVGDYSEPGTVLPPLTNAAADARSGTRALLCDGLNNCAVIDGNPVDQTLSWTVSAWFKPQTDGLGYITSTNRGFIYETGTNYPISFGLRGGPSEEQTNFQLYTLTSANQASSVDHMVPTEELDQWHHILETYDATTGLITAWLDGEAVYSIETAIEGVPVPLQTYSGFRLGTYRGVDGRWFKGLIDEVALWQRPLSASEAISVYTTGKAGLSLTDAGPELSLAGFTPIAGAPGAFELSWVSTPGLKYAIEASSDLADWSTTLVEEAAATAAVTSFRIYPTFPAPAGALYDPGAQAGGKRFYRVRLKL